MRDILVTVLVGLVMLVGLVGVVIPVLPDVLLIWLAALVYGAVVGWGRLGPWMFGLITMLGLVGIAAEVWVSGTGAKMGGGSIWGVLGGLALGLVGLIVFPPLGGLVGLALGTFLVEYLRFRDARKAFRATAGMGLGYGASFGVRLVLGLAMIAAWVVWVVGS